MSLPNSILILPDLKKMCPLRDSTNPHYLEAAKESRAWIDGYKIFVDRKRAFFIQGCNELLVSHTYPYANYQEFRTCCDFVNLLFVVDEVSDDQGGKDARATCEVFLNAMIHESWTDHSVLSKITKEFRARFVRTAKPACQRRFFIHCRNYIDAVSREAELREAGRVLPLVEFTPLRRENSAIRLCFGLFEFALGIDLPDEVFADPTFMRMYFSAADMVCWSNDLYSWNMEQAKGIGGNNVVTVLMQEERLSLQAAADRVGVHFDSLMQTFLHEKSNLRSWGRDVDPEVSLYVGAMEKWVSGNLVWSFETPRYFGRDHLRIKDSGRVAVRARGNPEDA